MIEIKILKHKTDMLQQIHVLQELYPSLTLEQYELDLDQMLGNNQYHQVAAFEQNQCLGIAGIWLGTKLWCGKYLEIDNLVVSQIARSKGVGHIMFEYIENIAKQEECTMMALDSYTSNFKAHKFFYNEGFAPKGFHFINILHKEKIR